MNLYNRLVLPALLDWQMRRDVLHAPRRQALVGATGRVLEIGFGSGANLPHYPPGIAALETVEPNGQLAKRALPRIAASPLQVRIHQGHAENLPFADASFDTVVSSFTLCSVTDPKRVLGEVAPILRPGGRFLFLEHGLSPDPDIVRWQRRLTPLQKRLGGNCHLNRDMAALVRDAAFASVESRCFFLPDLPKVGGYLTLGHALVPA